jgi:hypothetical protein
VVVEKFQYDVELENMIEKWLWQSHVQRRVIIEWSFKGVRTLWSLSELNRTPWNIVEFHVDYCERNV